MAGFVHRAKIEEYDPIYAGYKRFNVVYREAAGPTTYNTVTLVYLCIQDAPAGTLPTNWTSNQYWQALDNPDLILSDYWKPTYAGVFEYTPTVNRSQFNEGALGIASFGINNNPVKYGASWSNINQKEANGLLAFFEAYGGTHPFKLTLPEPIGLTKRFLAKNWNIRYDNWNLYSITAELEENFDIFGDENTESTADFQLVFT
jgi:phage-related protein